MMLGDRESDADLLNRLGSGDEEAFKQLYSAYRGPLFSFLLRISGRRDLAEDFSQEIWLRLVSHPPALEAEMPLGPWLFRVGRNIYISYLRSRGCDENRTCELTAIHFLSSSRPDPLGEFTNNEMRDRLQSALMRLPLSFRECLFLIAVAGMTPQQAAEILDLPAPTFRKRLSRAREMLARRLGLVK